MAGAAAALTEPHVLAHTKRQLFPDDGSDDMYAVVDTQFAQDRWIDDRRIDDEVRDALAPFNHVKVGTGYPDLVGVRNLENDFLSVDRVGDDPPLVAIEAKGYTGSGHVDVERAVIQAYDRLDEANVAFIAVPAASVSQSAQSMARELNVGVLAVEDDGAVTPVIQPRVVGNRTSSEASAIRFQASAQGVADKSFSLNHPKNYLAYPLAVYHARETVSLIEDRVVGASTGARTGAEFLGLIDAEPNGATLTPLGEEVVRFALAEYGSVDAALQKFDDWKRSRKRFCDLAPKWGLLTRRIVYDYPATTLLVEELQTMHDDGQLKPSLSELVEHLHDHHPTFTVELFIRGTDDVRGRALNGEGALDQSALEDGDVYHAPTVFQLKTILYHAGILTENGTEPSNLDSTTDEWALREPLDRFG